MAVCRAQCKKLFFLFLFFLAYAVAQWLGIRLQMIGVFIVAAVAFIAMMEHHLHYVNPGESRGGGEGRGGEGRCWMFLCSAHSIHTRTHI